MFVYAFVLSLHNKIIQAAEKKRCCLPVVSVRTVTEVNDN